MSTIKGEIIPISKRPHILSTIPQESLITLPDRTKALILRVLVAGQCSFRLWYRYADIWWPMGGRDEPLFEATPNDLEGRNERVYSVHSEARDFCLHLEEGDPKSVLFASIREVIPGEIV